MQKSSKSADLALSSGAPRHAEGRASVVKFHRKKTIIIAEKSFKNAVGVSLVKFHLKIKILAERSLKKSKKHRARASGESASIVNYS